MAKDALGAPETYFVKTGGTNTIATGVTNPPTPTLIVAIATVLTRNPHKLVVF